MFFAEGPQPICSTHESRAPFPYLISHIRETMVDIMARRQIRRPSDVLHDCDEAAGAFDETAKRSDLSAGSREKQIPIEPPTCVFWCAVALGALVRGNPIESVRISGTYASRMYIYIRTYAKETRQRVLCLSLAKTQPRGFCCHSPTSPKVTICLPYENLLEFVQNGEVLSSRKTETDRSQHENPLACVFGRWTTTAS